MRAVGEGHFGKKLFAANTNARLYNIAHAAVTARISNLSVVFYRCTAGNELGGLVLLGVHFKLYPLLAVDFNCLDVKGVK